MWPSWEKIETVVRAQEEARAIAELESNDSQMAGIRLLQRRFLWPFQRVVSAVAFGIASGLITIIFSYFVIVLLLHFQS
jgi:hypothetical protein